VNLREFFEALPDRRDVDGWDAFEELMLRKFHHRFEACGEHAWHGRALLKTHGIAKIYDTLRQVFTYAMACESRMIIGPRFYAAIGKLVAPIASSDRECVNHVLLEVMLAPLMNSDSTGGETWRRVTQWSARWVNDGLPMLVLTEKQCAALAFTDLNPEEVVEQRAPWRAFLLGLPKKTFRLRSSSVGEERLERAWIPQIAVSHYNEADCLGGPPVWSLRFDVEPTAVHLWSGNRTVEDLWSNIEFNNVPRLFDAEPAAIEKRAIAMGSRLVLTACAALSAYGVRQAEPEGKTARRGARKRKRKERRSKVATEYVLGMPVRVDLREQLRDYLGSDRERHFSVRWVVRGHYRNQPHGPRRALRRKRWIEPYWKGPLRNPVLVRQHELGEGEPTT